MKKLISILLTLLLLLQSVAVMARTEGNTAFEETLLQKLEIIPASVVDTDHVSRVKFAEILTNIIYYKGGIEGGSGETYYVDIPYTKEEARVINAVTARGIMNGVGEGIFAPNQNTTVEQAVCAVVNLLGYHQTAEYRGGYPDGYYSVASELGLLKGVSGKEQDITYAGVKKLLANALDTDMLVITGIGKEIQYETVEGDTLLTKEMGLQIVEGVLRGTYRSAITNESFCGVGEININGENYYVGDLVLDEYVGYAVTACFTNPENSKDAELIYIEKDAEENKVLNISAKDFVEISGARISYLSADSTREKSAKLEDDFDVLWNGSPLDIYSEEDFTLSDGNLILIDNDGDGLYNIVYLQEQKTAVVKFINRENKSIVDYYNAENGFELKDIPDENITVYDEKMKKISFSDISAEDVVTWYADKTENYYTLIVSSGNNITGTVNGIRENDVMTVVVDGEEYEVAPSFRTLIASKVTVGENGKLYLDYLNRVAGFDIGKGTSSWRYAYVVRSYIDETEEKCMLKLFTETGSMETYPIAENIKIDFQKPDDAENVVLGLGEEIVRFVTNGNDEISRLDTLSEDTDENSLVEKYSGSIAYKGLGVNSFMCTVALNEQTKVFIIPPAGSAASDYYVTGQGYFANDTTYNITAYGQEDKIASDVIVLKSANGLTGEAQSGVVKEANEALDDEDMPGFRLLITEFTGVSIKDIEYWLEDGVSASGIKAGQVVKYEINEQNKITKISILYNPETNERSGLATIGSDLGASTRIVFGKALRVEDGLMKLVDENSTGKPQDAFEIVTLSVYNSQGRIYKCDTNGKNVTISPATINDVFDYDSLGEKCSRVVVVTGMIWPRAMLIYNQD